MNINIIFQVRWPTSPAHIDTGGFALRLLQAQCCLWMRLVNQALRRWYMERKLVAPSRQGRRFVQVDVCILGKPNSGSAAHVHRRQQWCKVRLPMDAARVQPKEDAASESVASNAWSSIGRWPDQSIRRMRCVAAGTIEVGVSMYSVSAVGPIARSTECA